MSDISHNICFNDSLKKYLNLSSTKSPYFLIISFFEDYIPLAFPGKKSWECLLKSQYKKYQLLEAVYYDVLHANTLISMVATALSKATV